MKRKALLILSVIAILTFLLAVSVSAEKMTPPAVTDTYYFVNDSGSNLALSLKEEGKNVISYDEMKAADVTNTSTVSPFFGSFADNSHIELILAENIVITSGTENTGMMIRSPITVTVRTNGFLLAAINGGSTSRRNVFFLDHKDAYLRVIGNNGIDLPNGKASNSFVLPTSSGTNIQIPENCNLDIFHSSKVFAWVNSGNVYVENVRSHTQEELVYVEDKASAVSSEKTFEVVNSAMDSGTVAIGLLGQYNVRKHVYISNCYVDVLQAHTVLDGSYVENSTIVGGYDMDCWDIKNQLFTFTNCKIGGTFTTKSGRTHLMFVDCTFDDSFKWNLGGDGGGDSFAMVFTTATCESAGTYELHRTTNKGTAFPWESLVNEFLAENSVPLGHIDVLNVTFEGAKYVSPFLVTTTCTREGCGRVTETSYKAMFRTSGYSVPEIANNYAIAVGYFYDYEAICAYEATTGAVIDFGASAAVRDLLGEGNEPLDENGNAVVLSQGNVVSFSVSRADASSASSIEMKVILSEKHMDTFLLITGFILEKSQEKTYISYIQDTLVENNAFTYASYNSCK